MDKNAIEAAFEAFALERDTTRITQRELFILAYAQGGIDTLRELSLPAPSAA